MQLATKKEAKYDKCRVKVNYLAMEGINDSDEKIEEMIKLLERYKEKIEIRNSYLNYTKQAEKNGCTSPPFKRLRQIEEKLNKLGFKCYSFGTECNHGIACGQLAQNKISLDQ